MIGKPEWFKYRIFGWGLGIKSWQGIVYLIGVAAVLGSSIILATKDIIPIWITGVVFAFVLADTIHIMMQLPKVNDERENYHQLIIERNCSFAAIAALVAMAFYEAYKSGAFTNPAAVTTYPFDISILVVLGVMLATKIISTLYVKAKM